MPVRKAVERNHSCGIHTVYIIDNSKDPMEKGMFGSKYITTIYMNLFDMLSW
jgi:hypothetical protein